MMAVDLYGVGAGWCEQEVLAKCKAAAGSSMPLIRVVRPHASNESTELSRQVMTQAGGERGASMSGQQRGWWNGWERGGGRCEY